MVTWVVNSGQVVCHHAFLDVIAKKLPEHTRQADRNEIGLQKTHWQYSIAALALVVFSGLAKCGISGVAGVDEM